MEVSELVDLADWYDRQVPSVQGAYSQLLNLLQHNASQPNQQPLEEALNSLTSALRDMTFDALSIQQLSVLEQLEAREYLGGDGVQFVDRTIRTATYDAATAAARIQIAVQNVNHAKVALADYRSAVQELRFPSTDLEQALDKIVIRVGFQNDANIDNVTDWRDYGEEWYNIIRGVALAANESPEDTKVIGAATGSVIIILAGTVAVSSMLAVIMKNITGTTKEVISVGVAMENLRQQKILTSTMEAEFKKVEAKKRAEATKTVMAELNKYLHKSVMGDAKIALEASVKRLLAFNEKGGMVDFVAPPDADEEADEGNEEGAGKLLSDARRIIHEYQGEREALRLLTHQPDTANDNEVDSDDSN
jgi:hypothetical protein